MTVCTDTCDQRDIGKSHSEEEISASDDFEYAESEEEEPEDDGETGEEEEPEDDGETGEDDSDSEDESDSGPDLARGIGNIETSSEDDEDLNELFPKEPEIEHSWRELDKDAPRGDEVPILLHVKSCYMTKSEMYTLMSSLWTLAYEMFFESIFCKGF